MRDVSGDVAQLRKRLAEAETYLDVATKRVRLGELEQELSRPGLWDDQERAKQVQTEHKFVKDDVDVLTAIAQRIDDVEVLAELAREEADESQAPEIERELAELSSDLDRLELRSLFTGDYDEGDAICSINSGEGGTDAQDWGEMLLRMYLRWAERRGFENEVAEV